MSRLLATLLAKMERHHWAGLGGSVLLHLAMLLGLRHEPPPEVQPVSFEIALEAPKPELQTKVKTHTRLKETHTKPRKTLAKKKKPVKREPHTLEAEWREESQPPKNTPNLDLPDSQELANLTAVDTGASAHRPGTKEAAPGKTVTSSAPSASTHTASAGSITPGEADQMTEPGTTSSPSAVSASAAVATGPVTDPGIALAVSPHLSPGQSAQGQTPGAQNATSAAGLSASGTADSTGQGPGSLSSSQGSGNGLNVADGSGAQSSSSREAPPLAGGEPQGIRLSASGSLSERATLPEGRGALAAGPEAVDAGPAVPNQAQGSASALASSQAGGATAAPTAAADKKLAGGGAAARPSSGSAGASTGKKPDRLTESGSQGKSSVAPQAAGNKVSAKERGKQSSPATASRGDSSNAGPTLAASASQLGHSGTAATQRMAVKTSGNGPGMSQSGKSLALAPGEPGSSPNLAVTLQTLVAMPSARPGAGKGTGGRTGLVSPGSGGGAGYPGTTPYRAGGNERGMAAPARLALAGTGTGASMAPAGGRLVQAGHGTLSGALPSQAGATGTQAAPDTGRLQALKTPDKQVAQPDSQVRPLDVLAPSTFCPLPLPGHSFPDNRPPRAESGNANQPAYAQDNPSFTFPIQALLGNVQGKVTVRVEVQPDGKPGRMWLKQSSGSGILDRDALSQLNLWHFIPARRDGQPVTAWIDVPVVYRLQENK